MVVMMPAAMTKLSCSTLAIGARQFVVHDALEITVMSLVIDLWFTPYTMVASTWSPGAEISTLRAPSVISADAFSLLVKMPVHSNATSTPAYGTLVGSCSADTLIGPQVRPP